MLGFCEKCRDMVEYYVREKVMTKNIKGKEVNYKGKVAYCDECKSEIFVAEIRDYNLMKLDEAFREEEDLITVSEIELILEKYDIGKRPLSLLLGWGELTLTRYLDGDIPTKQYSDTLKEILNNPYYMKELLEKNKGKIKDIAYRKTSVAIADAKADGLFNIDSINKIDNIVKYLLVNSSDITPLQQQAQSQAPLLGYQVPSQPSMSSDRYSSTLIQKYVRREMLMNSPLFEEWVSEERKEAVRDTNKKRIIETLELKFDFISKNTREYIESIEDDNIINRLFEKAIKTVSVEDFEKLLEKVKNLQ
ncbi:MAG: hypothetical protein ACTHW2_06350 [Tissierella sp.]|uniref:hypothetical protein n=1 Tax=Tissierella sp. TaxID=41274 RepID=UPI003F973954